MAEPSEKAKMLDGELYNAFDPELLAERERAAALCARYNGGGDRTAILRELLGAIGEGSAILPAFACDYGYNIRIGRGGFINYNCVFLDCAAIEIGDRVLIAPAVQLYTATHPLDAETRRDNLEYALPIRIGDDVWIGGGAIVLPDVEIGDRAVIGAGAVVTRDVAPDTVVAGNPARVIRRLPRG
ncbi:MAG TPA: sugar O-acetyltransferase [Stellaceae bacterium]|nr:sugar O-acetyltransferase [Stellaceae bacterium]